MRTAIDSNVISALWSREPVASQMEQTLEQIRLAGGMVMGAPVYAELAAHPHASARLIDEFCQRVGIVVEFDIDEPIWREAARSFGEHAERRRRSGGGVPKRLLADFIIGAHALLRADRLLTLDPTRYARSFPKLRVESA